MPPRDRDAAGARQALLATARRDLGAAMTLAVPFVLRHPSEASVLGELAAIADRSVADSARFRDGVRVLLRATLRADRGEAEAA
jgi:hypothetical protein